MQRPSPRFRSEEYFVYEISEDVMLVPTWMSTNMADGNQQKHLLASFATKTANLFFKELINIKVILFLLHELFM